MTRTTTKVAEKALQTQIIEYLRGCGAYVYNAGGSASAAKGTPDLLVCYRGRFIGLEVKKPKDSYGVTKPQQMRIAQIRGADGLAGVVTSIDEVREGVAAIDIAGGQPRVTRH